MPAIEYEIDAASDSTDSLLKLPPTISLGGSPITAVAIFRPYIDLGATATDFLGRPLPVAVSGLPNPGSNFTAAVTREPAIITYAATDAANQTVMAVSVGSAGAKSFMHDEWTAL